MKLNKQWSSYILVFIQFSILSIQAFAEEFDTGWTPKGVSRYIEDEKIVVHLNQPPNTEQIKAMGNSLSNMKKELPSLKLKVVVHGNALFGFKKSELKPEFKEFLDRTRKLGVEYVICHKTMQMKKIKVADLYEVETKHIVPAAILEISKLQREGYSYIRLF